ncbi:hypothetical protein YDYSY3_49470 [Paenibacillus chitinolyticus]|nr:hypothetical protein YDYSY3_49470 [Paenibacillus chitinolyticus]
MLFNRLNRTKTCFALFTIASGIMVGCTAEKPNTGQQPQPSPKTVSTPSSKEKTVQDDYISLTNTEYVNGVDSKDGMVMKIYSYGITDKKLTNAGNLPYTSQSPLSFLSLTDGSIYYPAASDTQKGDQLTVYRLSTAATERLSSDLFAINFILPTPDNRSLVLLAVKNGDRMLKTMFYDKGSKKLTVLDDDDQSTQNSRISVNPETNKTYVVRFSDEEDRNNLLSANESQTPMTASKRTIFEIDNVTKETKKVFELDKEDVLTLSARGDKLFLATSPYFNKEPLDYSMLDLKSGKREKLDLPIKARSGAFLSQEAKGIYLLGSSSTDESKSARGIYYYDFESKKMDEIFIQKAGFINQFMLISK